MIESQGDASVLRCPCLIVAKSRFSRIEIQMNAKLHRYMVRGSLKSYVLSVFAWNLCNVYDFHLLYIIENIYLNADTSVNNIKWSKFGRNEVI